MARHKWRSCNKLGVILFFSVPTARVGPLLKSIGATRIQGYCPPQYYNSTAYLTCTPRKHCTSREILLSILLTHRHKVAAPDHSIRLGSMLPKFSPLVYALCCRFYCCWCRYYTTARLNAAQVFAVCVGVMLPILVLLVLLLHYGEVKCCPNFRHGVGVMLPEF